MLIRRAKGGTSTRQCSGCRRILPLDFAHFYRERAGCEGFKTRCRDCHNAKTRECVSRRPEHYAAKRRAAKRRRYHELKRDPDWLSKRRAYEREYQRRRLGIADKPETWKGGKRQGNAESIPRIPAEPFAAWLRTMGDYPAEIARAVNLPERRVRAVLRGEQANVELDTVDRAALHVGVRLEDVLEGA